MSQSENETRENRVRAVLPFTDHCGREITYEDYENARDLIDAWPPIPVKTSTGLRAAAIAMAVDNRVRERNRRLAQQKDLSPNSSEEK